mmetsp:Transcript_15345/g.25541  ORF Transcript_15345/g.25541 Transcript_15345/m.25541 type:complete len:253 (+) Transcript_15345:2792-3550(+)
MDTPGRRMGTPGPVGTHCHPGTDIPGPVGIDTADPVGTPAPGIPGLVGNSPHYGIPLVAPSSRSAQDSTPHSDECNHPVRCSSHPCAPARSSSSSWQGMAVCRPQHTCHESVANFVELRVQPSLGVSVWQHVWAVVWRLFEFVANCAESQAQSSVGTSVCRHERHLALSCVSCPPHSYGDHCEDYRYLWHYLSHRHHLCYPPRGERGSHPCPLTSFYHRLICFQKRKKHCDCCHHQAFLVPCSHQQCGLSCE